MTAGEGAGLDGSRSVRLTPFSRVAVTPDEPGAQEGAHLVSQKRFDAWPQSVIVGCTDFPLPPTPGVSLVLDERSFVGHLFKGGLLEFMCNLWPPCM